jgi:Zn-dependent M28 family amino/carboxypeptidase
MKPSLSQIIVPVFSILLLGFNPPQDKADSSASAVITAEKILGHIEVLASDEFEGRAPGTKGETLSVNYIIEQCKKLGLEPGNPDGTYRQHVPLAGFRAQNLSANFTAGSRTITTDFPNDIVLVSRRFVNGEVSVKNSDMIFVGYGIAAPEYGWDDYKNVDVRGKTIVMLINDPPIPDPKDPSRLDSTMFGGKAMTYYGRWTYKYEIAAQKGAAAAIIVHETKEAGYPFQVVSGSRNLENFDIVSADSDTARTAVESWITVDKARELFAACGKNFDELKKSAVRKDFRPVTLGAQAYLSLQNSVRKIYSDNVIAKLEGSDPKLKNEYIVYTAHWDHLGRDLNLKGDQIYNGAVDNASGVAAILEAADAFAHLKIAPKRTVLFLLVTSEEKGLLGSHYYCTVPLYPLSQTLAEFNVDGLNHWGRTKDVISIGEGRSSLDETLAAAAKEQDRMVFPDRDPEKGYFYRSDHFEFAKKGVPVLDIAAGFDFRGQPEGYGKQKHDEYTARFYHKVTDEIQPDWDLSGGVEDAQLLFEVGYHVAQGENRPVLNPGVEFSKSK